MSRQRVVGLVVFAWLLAATAEAVPPPRIAAIRRCRADERGCRRRCLTEPPGPARKGCRMICKRLRRECLRRARGRPFSAARLGRCRAHRKQCNLGCWRAHARDSPGRRACVRGCHRAYGRCARGARRAPP